MANQNFFNKYLIYNFQIPICEVTLRDMHYNNKNHFKYHIISKMLLKTTLINCGTKNIFNKNLNQNLKHLKKSCNDGYQAIVLIIIVSMCPLDTSYIGFDSRSVVKLPGMCEMDCFTNV